MKKECGFAIVKEMLQTPQIIKDFNTSDLTPVLISIKKTKKLFLSGEGSSRIFPAKNIIYQNLKQKSDLTIQTEAARQASELNLNSFTLFAASNSGKTKEVIQLLQLKKAQSQFSLTADKDALIKQFSDKTFVLNCQKEDAVAATKSVIEQALFYQNLLAKYNGKNISKNTLAQLSKKAELVLKMKIPQQIIDKIANSNKIYFAGRNNGVAEEATLKTNEITRKSSDFLEGTYAVHGIEEIMQKNETIVLIEPFKQEEEKFKEVLSPIGINVIAISSRKTLFPTIIIPTLKDFDEYIQLMACWNILVEVGLKLKINLDKPTRARKIGNEIK